MELEITEKKNTNAIVPTRLKHKHMNAANRYGKITLKTSLSVLNSEKEIVLSLRDWNRRKRNHQNDGQIT